MSFDTELLLSVIDSYFAGQFPLSVNQLAGVDQLHAGGLAATHNLSDWLSLNNSSRVLDIGCGLGGPARYIADRYGCQADAADFDKDYITTAQQLDKRVRYRGQVNYLIADGCLLPSRDCQYDAAVCWHVAMNIADRVAFYREIYRVLKPGGQLLLTEQAGNESEDIQLQYPVPWASVAGQDALRPLEYSFSVLNDQGFELVKTDYPEHAYIQGYQKLVQWLESNDMQKPGLHHVFGDQAIAMVSNALANLQRGAVKPFVLLAERPA